MTESTVGASREALESLPLQAATSDRNRALTWQIRLFAALLVASLALTVASLLWSAHSQDEIARNDSRHLANTALMVQMGSLQKILTDYTWWDEAYQNLVGTFDPAWYDENFADADYLRDTFGITGSFVIGPDGRLLRHMRNSTIVEDAPRLNTAVYFKSGINGLIQKARRPVDGKFVAAAGFIKLQGQFYVAAVRIVDPHTKEISVKAAVTQTNAYVAGVMRPLDAPLLKTLAKDFGLPDLSLTAAGDPAGQLPLHLANGEGFGALGWHIVRPSYFVFGVVLPGMLAVMACIGLLGWYVLTSLRRGQANLLQAMHEAQLADRSKTEFLANMSHELRTPLNAIIGFSQMMRDQTLGPMGNEQYTEYSADIHKSGQHLLDIINDVLDLSKIEAGNLELQIHETTLPTVIDAVRRLIEPRAVTKNIALHMDVAHDVPATIYADGRALKQILLNLLSNAVKFTPPGGRVTMRITRNINGTVAVTVSDTGRGIAKDHLPLVMLPFHQVDGPFTSSDGGTGLGLPISASLAVLHGGDLQLESEVGKGTTVLVTIPNRPVAAAQAA
jgi:signal transduction histidine kinase